MHLTPRPPRALHRYCVPLVVCVLLVLARTATAGSITIERAEARVENDLFVIDANARFAFSDDALEALRSGIALYVDLDVRITRVRRFVWDPSVLVLSRRYQVERHALTDRYVITDLVTDERRTHESVDATIDDLGRIRDIPVAEVDRIDADGDYDIALRASLDLESLPAPLRPLAYISPSWRMSSGWYEWTLTR